MYKYIDIYIYRKGAEATVGNYDTKWWERERGTRVEEEGEAKRYLICKCQKILVWCVADVSDVYTV